MKKYPTPVAVGLAINENNQILLLKRNKPPYQGLYSMPGGKIEIDEHPDEASIREVLEETGIKTEFIEHLGIVSEQIKHQDQIEEHFLIHLCHLKPVSNEITHTHEGEAEWFPFEKIHELKDLFIPSDLKILEKLYFNKTKKYYNCKVERINDEYFFRSLI